MIKKAKASEMFKKLFSVDLDSKANKLFNKHFVPKVQHKKELKERPTIKEYKLKAREIYGDLIKKNQKLEKKLSECREDNIKLTKEIQEQDKELSDLNRIFDMLVNLYGEDIRRFREELKEKKK